MLKSWEENQNTITPQEVKKESQFSRLAILFFPGHLLRGLLFSLFLISVAMADTLTASYYSVQSLKQEGTWKTSKGVMANGKHFNENDFTCATRLFPLGSMLLITNLNNGKKVIVRVTDRIGKRFATKRIDLSLGAFKQICDPKQGLCQVSVEKL